MPDLEEMLSDDRAEKAHNLLARMFAETDERDLPNAKVVRALLAQYTRINSQRIDALKALVLCREALSYWMDGYDVPEKTREALAAIEQVGGGDDG